MRPSLIRRRVISYPPACREDDLWHTAAIMMYIVIYDLDGDRMRETKDTWLPQPDLDEVDVGTLLQAPTDPMCRRIARLLEVAGEGSCASLDVPVKHPTVSHHLRTPCESGMVAARPAGNARLSRLRGDDLKRRLPGLPTSILYTTPPASSTSPAAG